MYSSLFSNPGSCITHNTTPSPALQSDSVVLLVCSGFCSLELLASSTRGPGCRGLELLNPPFWQPLRSCQIQYCLFFAGPRRVLLCNILLDWWDCASQAFLTGLHPHLYNHYKCLFFFSDLARSLPAAIWVEHKNGAWLTNHDESNENKIHSSALFDLQQYPFQHGQPTVIQSLSAAQSNRAASVNICWQRLEHKPVDFIRLTTRALLYSPWGIFFGLFRIWRYQKC